MKSPKWMAVLAVITSLSLAALACGGGGAAPTDTPAPTKPPAATRTPKPEEPTQEPTKEAPTEEPTKESSSGGDGELSIVNHSSYIDNYGYVHVVGLINNGTEDPITNVEMTVTLVDKDGNTVLKDSDGNPTDSETFTPLLYTLDVDQNSPFDFWVSLDEGVEADAYTVEITDAEKGDVDRGELEIENAQMVSDSDGNWYFSGELVNLTDAPILINSFAGAALDDNDNVLAADYTFSITRYLYPAGDENGNDRTPFIVTLDGPADDTTQWAAYWDADIADEMDPSGVELEITNSFWDTYGNFHLVGTATNSGSDALSVSLVAGLYDTDGVVLDAATTSTAVYLHPDETAPFHFQYFANVNYNEDEANRLDTYTVQIDRYWTYETSFDTVDLETANEDVSDDGDGIVTAKGEVTNTSDQDLSSITVIVLIYDGDTLVSSEWTSVYPDGDAIKPGDTNEFEVTVYIDPDADTSNYEFITVVEGYEN